MQHLRRALLKPGGGVIITMERFLIVHCSPTLARIKAGSLFSCSADSISGLASDLNNVNRKLNSKDVFLKILRYNNGRALILVYRRSLLERELCKKKVFHFLNLYGYESYTLPYCIEHLKKRCAHSSSFPHEIGIFLGYPFEDVVGFIENCGKNSKCSGCWKVYSDECKAAKLFAQYRKCTEIYTRLFLKGKSIMQLTVAA